MVFIKFLPLEEVCAKNLTKLDKLRLSALRAADLVNVGVSGIFTAANYMDLVALVQREDYQWQLEVLRSHA
jgi:hypothetical protein